MKTARPTSSKAPSTSALLWLRSIAARRGSLLLAAALLALANPAHAQDEGQQPPAADPAPEAQPEPADDTAKEEGVGAADDDDEVIEIGEDGEVVEEEEEVIEIDDGEVVEDDDEVIEVDDEDDDEIVVDDDDDDKDKDDDDGDMKIGPVLVTATAEEIARVGGSAHVIEEDDLKEMEYDDAHSVLLQVPGLYVRQEDGFGLRPNIGLRGANSDRSKKVTLMEDGILLGPAPYSAPAAYYFPLMTRITGVEVYKGPAAVLYGPNTIGGAVNFVSRDIPFEPAAEIDVAYGSFNTGKLHLYYGDSVDWGGFLLEGAHIQSDGFKELDGGGDTGFSKSEVILKTQVNSDLSAENYHRLRLQLGYARESSNETYLGLTDDDFKANPYRRYAASQLAKMEWTWTQIQLRYRLDIGEHANINVTLYRHGFERSWRKANRFLDGPELGDILADPTGGRRALFYDVLTGAEDATEAETLQIGTNARTYVSQGFQTEARFELGEKATFNEETGEQLSMGWSSEFKLGLRLHHDQIERNHTEEGFLMQSGRLVSDGNTLTLLRNRGQARATAVHVANITTIGALTLAPGARFELINTELRNLQTKLTKSAQQQVLLPGLGLHYAFTEELGALAGVHRGFSPVSPGQPDDVEPELSTNYELGMRYLDLETGTLIELIGFFNDYTNLIGECSFSSGCDDELLDQQFNAGEVQVYGLEAVADHSFALGKSGWSIPVRLSYTLTQSAFQTDFVSKNPQFGEVESGAELPYVPTHQASFKLGLSQEFWSISAVTTYVDEMREIAGKGTPEPGDVTDGYVIVDLATTWNFWEGASAYLKADNALNVQPIAARRPFGARPARPFLLQIGARYEFF